MPAPVLSTSRLRLTALGADALDAWIDGDAAGLFELTGVRFTDPPSPPPLLGRDLPAIRDRAAQDGEDTGWWVWLVSDAGDERVRGVCGLDGPPDEDGTVVLGYSVYPEHEGHGIATEAASALVTWVLAQPGVARVVAAVPRWNEASAAVARKLGMEKVGQEVAPRVGEVDVYEVRRGP